MICRDERTCFAKARDGKNCEILADTYPKGVMCPFCKRDRTMTKGRFYPYVEPKYGYVSKREGIS